MSAESGTCVMWRLLGIWQGLHVLEQASLSRWMQTCHFERNPEFLWASSACYRFSQGCSWHAWVVKQMPVADTPDAQQSRRLLVH